MNPQETHLTDLAQFADLGLIEIPSLRPLLQIHGSGGGGVEVRLPII